MTLIPEAKSWITAHLEGFSGPRAGWDEETVDHRNNLLGVLVLWELHRETLQATDAAQCVPTREETAGVIPDEDLVWVADELPRGMQPVHVPVGLTLIHKPTGIRIQSSRGRSQVDNRAICLAGMEAILTEPGLRLPRFLMGEQLPCYICGGCVFDYQQSDDGGPYVERCLCGNLSRKKSRRQLADETHPEAVVSNDREEGREG